MYQKPNILPLEKNDEYIAYHHQDSKTNNNLPGIIFLGGFMSDMTGSKATALQGFCEKHDLSFTRFDYQGHGESSGVFSEGNIGQWLENTLTVIDNITSGPLIIVGSSMGGWLMLLAALARKDRVKGLVGIASAPDFTEHLIWDQLTEEQKNILKTGESIPLPCDQDGDAYIITHQLIEEARTHMLMHQEIDITCPVRLLHGMKDEDVPYNTSVKLAEKLASEDVRVTLVKDGDHRMSTDELIDLISQTVYEMTQAISS